MADDAIDAGASAVLLVNHLNDGGAHYGGAPPLAALPLPLLTSALPRRFSRGARGEA